MRIQKLGKRFILALQALTLVLGLGTFALAPALSGTAFADAATCPGVSGGISAGAQCAMPTGANSNLFGDGGIFQIIANTLIFIVGAVAVLFLIIGGLRYVISNGDPKAVTSAKDTILYAIIGIIISILSYAAVTFVIATFANKSGS